MEKTSLADYKDLSRDIFIKLSVVKDRFYRGDVMRNTSLEEELRSGKTCVSTTVGDSMEPMLRNRRDTIIIEPVHGRLKRYDLPLYRRPDGKYVLHRILHVKKEGYIICGDQSAGGKRMLPEEWILGVVDRILSW